MRKLTLFLLIFSLFSLSIFAQAGRSRPRVIVTGNPPNGQTTAPSQTSGSTTTQTTDSNQQTTKRPPVLTGDTKGSAQTADTQADSAAQSGDDEVIRVETNLVTIPVSVLDRNGRFIPGLRKTDFHIYEDGVEQKIEYFAPVEQPFTVILMLDVSNSTEFKIDEIQNAAIAFVNQLRADDRIMVMSFDEKVHILSPITNNRRVLIDAIRQADFGGGTSLYEAVDYSINTQLRQIEGRKAVVLFSDGVDTTSRRANYQGSVRDAEEADALFYPIHYDTFGDMNGGMSGGGGGYPGGRRGGGWGGILGAILTGGNVQIGNTRGGGGTGQSRAEYETGRRYMGDLARTTGGRMFEATSLYNINAAFSGIAEELRQQYSVGYYPEKVGENGQRKQIKVRTDRTDAVVRAKNSYIVGETEAKNTPKAKPKLTNSRLPF